MTLFDAYQRYKQQRKILEDDFRVRIRESGTPAPEILMEMSRSFQQNKDIAGFITYTHKHPLTIQKLLEFMSISQEKKWSCKAKLSAKIPEHIEFDLKNADKYNNEQFTNICDELLQDMQSQTFFELFFHTSVKNEQTETEANLVIPFVFSTATPYEKLKTRPNLLNNINFYECLFDGIFNNEDTIWTICPQKEYHTFLPTVVKDYMKTVNIIQKEHPDKQL